ncbi:unnamed protein product, partial [Prunus brigantina]
MLTLYIAVLVLTTLVSLLTKLKILSYKFMKRYESIWFVSLFHISLFWFDLRQDLATFYS